MRRIDVAARARSDIGAALATSRERFGAAAQRRYEALIARAQKLLANEPHRAGVQQREDLPGVYLYHLRHARARGTPPKLPRHIVVFTYDDKTLTILRLLHDSMDVDSHLSE